MHSHRRSRTRRKFSIEDEKDQAEEKELDELCSSLIGDGEKWRTGSGILPSNFMSPDGVPPFECFATQIRSFDAKQKLIRDLRVGDELCVRVRRAELAGIYVQPVCVLRPFRRSLNWIDDFQVLIARDVRDGGLERPNDLLKVVVVEPEGTDDLRLRLLDSSARLAESDLPLYFRNGEALEKDETFDSYLRECTSLTNANAAELFAFETTSTASFLPELQGKAFSTESRAPYLRRKQNEELSMQSVVKGVEKVRTGDYTPAIQHFFKALEIYERNVEALVGRAAAYANLGKYDLAEADLDVALSINGEHVNAKHYMVEVLMQAGNELVEKKEMDEAKKKYEKILRLKDDKRARDALAKIRKSPEVEIIKVKKRRQSAEEMRRRSREIEEEERRKRHDAKKLAEMERFIARLKHENKT